MLQPKLLPGHRGRVLQVFRLGEPNPVRRLRCTTAEAPLLLLSPQLSGEGTVRSISHHNGGHPRPGHVVLEPLQTPVVAGIHPLDRLCFVALNNAASGLEQLHKGLGAGGLKGRRVFDHHRPSPAGLHRSRHHRLEILLAGRNQRPEPFTAFQPAQGVQGVSTLIGEQNGEIPLVSEGGKGPQIRRRGSHQQLELRRGHQLRIGRIAGVGPMPGNLREGLTTGLHRRLAQTKALEEVVPQFSIAVPHRQQHRQPWAADATGHDRLAADERGCNNTPRQPRPTSPLRLRHGIGGKQPDPRKLGRGVGLVRFCHRGFRPTV